MAKPTLKVGRKFAMTHPIPRKSLSEFLVEEMNPQKMIELRGAKYLMVYRPDVDEVYAYRWGDDERILRVTRRKEVVCAYSPDALIREAVTFIDSFQVAK